MLHGDLDTSQVNSFVKGNTNVLMATFMNQIENSDEYNTLMLSMLGAYLANNPEERNKFIKGLIITGSGINPN